MPAVVAIPAIIGAVGSIVAAKIGSNAANKAAQTQTTAANNALTLQQQQYANAQSALTPWITTGSQAATTLGSLMGLGGGGGGGGTGASGTTPASATTPFYNTQNGGVPRNYTQTNIGSQEGPLLGPNQDTGPVGRQRLADIAGQVDQTSAAAQRGSSYVTMRAPGPEGEVAQIPAAQVPHFERLGATVLG
jgi:hypothetical protein